MTRSDRNPLQYLGQTVFHPELAVSECFRVCGDRCRCSQVEAWCRFNSVYIKAQNHLLFDH